MAGNEACKTFIPLLSPYVDGELSPADRTVVERHLSACRDCTGRAADLRATSGLVRIGMEFAADEVDFKDFAQKVMARVTPEKPPLLERWRISLSEMFLYQRGPLLVGAAAVVLALIAVPLLLRERTPLGYASQKMAVQSVEAREGAHVAPVVMTTEKGDAIIWVVEQPKAEQPAAQSPDEEDGEEDAFPNTNQGTDLKKAPPRGGEL